MTKVKAPAARHGWNERASDVVRGRDILSVDFRASLWAPGFGIVPPSCRRSAPSARNNTKGARSKHEVAHEDRDLQRERRQRASAEALDWLADTGPDIVCLQEVKTDDAKFPAPALERAGYGAVCHGQRSHHGATLARGGVPTEIRRGLPGDPADNQARYLEAEVDGLTVASIYLPNQASIANLAAGKGRALMPRRESGCAC